MSKIITTAAGTLSVGERPDLTIKPPGGRAMAAKGVDVPCLCAPA